MNTIVFNSSYYNRRLRLFLIYPFAALSLIASFYVAFNTPAVDGVECLFLLPLSFAICCLSFNSVLAYQRGAWALKAFYVVLIFRYVVMPVVTCYMGHMSQGVFSAQAYRYSIFIEIVELVASLFFLKRLYIPRYQKLYKRYDNNKECYSDLSIGGVLVILFSAFVVVKRGLSSLTMYMRVGIITDDLEDAIYGYDIWLAQTMLAFMVIIVTSIFQKRNDKKNSILNSVLPLLFGMMSCLLAFGNNRMMIVFFALSALSVLTFAFPKAKSFVSLLIISAFTIMIVSFTMMKNFKVDISEGGATVENDDLALALSKYICTTEGIARTYDFYYYCDRSSKMSIMTPFSGIIEKIPLLRLPATYPSVKRLIKQYPPTWRLAQEGSEICPMAGEAIFYGSPIMGWLIDIVFMYFVIFILVELEIRSKLERNIGKRYLATWLSVTCGMIMCFNLGLVFYQFNFVPFFTYCALLINDKVRIKKRSLRIV